MRFCTLLLTFPIDSWLPFTNAVSRSKQLTYCVQCYCYPQGWKPKLQWQYKLKWLHLSVFFVRLNPSSLWNGPCVSSAGSSHHSVLDFINTLFNLASSQQKPKYSTDLAVRPSAGIGPSSTCMCSLAHSVGGGPRSLGCEAGAPWSPGPGSFESCGLFLEGPRGNQAGPTGLRQASCWHQAGGEEFIPALAEASHAGPLLTRLARCRHFPVLGSVVSLGCRYALHW